MEQQLINLTQINSKRNCNCSSECCYVNNTFQTTNCVIIENNNSNLSNNFSSSHQTNKYSSAIATNSHSKENLITFNPYDLKLNQSDHFSCLNEVNNGDKSTANHIECSFDHVEDEHDTLYSNASIINQFNRCNEYSLRNLIKINKKKNTKKLETNCNLHLNEKACKIDESIELENNILRLNLNELKEKVIKYEKIKENVKKIYKLLDEITYSVKKQDQLEKKIRQKLKIKIEKLKEENNQLKKENDTLTTCNLTNLVIDSTGTVSPCYSTNSVNSCELLITQLLVTESKYFSSDVTNCFGLNYHFGILM